MYNICRQLNVEFNKDIETMLNETTKNNVLINKSNVLERKNYKDKIRNKKISD